jgi:hypothetical protein
LFLKKKTVISRTSEMLVLSSDNLKTNEIIKHSQKNKKLISSNCIRFVGFITHVF